MDHGSASENRQFLLPRQLADVIALSAVSVVLGTIAMVAGWHLGCAIAAGAFPLILIVALLLDRRRRSALWGMGPCHFEVRGMKSGKQVVFRCGADSPKHAEKIAASHGVSAVWTLRLDPGVYHVFEWGCRKSLVLRAASERDALISARNAGIISEPYGNALWVGPNAEVPDSELGIKTH